MGFSPKRFDGTEPSRLLSSLQGPVVRIQRTYLADEANGVYFVNLGQASASRGDDPLAYFNLVWSEHVITIEARPKFANENGREILLFDIARLGIPKALNCDIEGVRKTIEDAVAICWSESFGAPIPARATLPSTIEWN